MHMRWQEVQCLGNVSSELYLALLSSNAPVFLLGTDPFVYYHHPSPISQLLQVVL